MTPLLRILLLFLFISTTAYSQTIKKELIVDGVRRTYSLYLPSGFSGESGLPLVINMHGLGSNATEQAAYSRFNTLADVDNFIVVYPEGLEATVPDINFTGQHWNAYFDTGIDDVGFIDLLIDVIWNQYQIDVSKVYATGMSNGGFMSYTLACELNDRFAAIASVTGSMVVTAPIVCNAEIPVPVAQFHGTADGVVPFEGSNTLLSMDELIELWTDLNGCVTDGVVGEDLEDKNDSDNSTVTRFVYSDCDDNGIVDFYRINNGGHTWPGAFIIVDAGPTNKDIDATRLIGDFFAQYTHPNPRMPEVITNIEPEANTTIVYPTRFENYLRFNLNQNAEVTLMQPHGAVLSSWNASAGPSLIQTESWPSGLYLLRIKHENGRSNTVKIIK